MGIMRSIKGKIASTWSASLLIAMLSASLAQPQAPPRYVITDLGALLPSNSEATAINNLGQVVGITQTLLPNGGGAFLYNAGVMRYLSLLKAYGINDRGQVVGTGPDGYIHSHAFLFTPGGTDGLPGNPEVKDLGWLCDFTDLFFCGHISYGNSRANGVNNFGLVTGFADSLTPNFVWGCQGFSVDRRQYRRAIRESADA